MNEREMDDFAMKKHENNLFFEGKLILFWINLKPNKINNCQRLSGEATCWYFFPRKRQRDGKILKGDRFNLSAVSL